MSINLMSIFKKSLNNNLKTSWSFKNIKGKSFLFSFQMKSFTTDHKIDEKHSLEYIESGVFEVLKSAVKCKQDRLNRSASLDELGFDSLDIVELVIGLEERFNVNIAGKHFIYLDDDSMKIQSVLDMIQMFHSYYAKKTGTTQPSINTEKTSPENI